MERDLKKCFNLGMWNIYKLAKYEAKYNATRYLQMLGENGGLETAHILINASTVSDGYTVLWKRGGLDLTVEALIFDNPEYHELFTEHELAIIKKRLIDYQYAPALR